MTQEEKAKAYDEALEKARNYIEVDDDNTMMVHAKGVMQIIFPELRESEYERIRKGLVEYLKADRDYHPCQSNSFYEDAIAYLEKQKENPKPAHSIPSDCVSDAKCEDRWHKVADSLPDNGRLVLAQDCLGNTLLARYDGEGNWEVSVYDNNDYYCRNTITKWCEIPSEKQKEQKPTDLPPGFYFIYLDGKKYYSKEFRFGDMKMKVMEDSAPCGEGVTVSGEKPAEWSKEDEEMLNSCISSIEESKENRYAYKETDGDTSYDREIAFMKSLPERFVLQPMQEWSDEDETRLTNILIMLKEYLIHHYSKDDIDKSVDWLENRVKPLRSQPRWKPSKEQMIAIHNMIPFVKSVGGPLEAFKPLESLYEDLKKL